MILTLISFPVPGNAQDIQTIMLNFIYLDILMTDQWFVPYVYGDESEANDSGLNRYFEINGFTSKSLIKNLQSTFIYLILYAFLILLMLLAYILSSFSLW